MNLKTSYGFDKQKAEKGVWCDLIDGGRVLLGMLGTPMYQNAIMRHTQKFQAKSRLGKLTAMDMNEITVQAEADAVVFGWDGIYEDDQNLTPFPFTRDNVLYALKEYPGFRQEIEEYASDRDRFQAQARDLETDSKN